MNYYELKLTLTPNTETNRDVASAILAEIGFESFVESERGLDAFVSEKNYSEEALAETLQTLPLMDTRVQYHVEFIQGQDWNEEWEKNFFQPILINDEVVIHSSFHQDIPQVKYDIVIDPKMAFGTGHHQTTSLMVSYLLETDTAGKSFLDMGCGTAVLAILANMKGANPVVAIDIDEWAYENSLENIRLNGTPDIRVLLGDASLLGKESYDIIFANINRNILLADIPTYASCLNGKAALYMSGFYREDIPAIREMCESQGLQFVSYKEKDNWVAAYFSKQ
ncbi:50S ribosomal protein L11 methyltransferase [Bacteroidales bacterium OttesenSCG-928-L03]|nr:50S ribosomal protein L11 methyltransferase [Bacteroidales bacterium OttesenSCG-928-L03]